MLRETINLFQVPTTANRGDKNVSAIVQRKCYSRKGISLRPQANAQQSQGFICHVSLHTT